MEPRGLQNSNKHPQYIAVVALLRGPAHLIAGVLPTLPTSLPVLENRLMLLRQRRYVAGTKEQNSYTVLTTVQADPRFLYR